MEKKLSGEELVALLNGGGWEVVGGREMRDEGGFMPHYAVVNASVTGGRLSIATVVSTFQFSDFDIAVVEEWLVEVRCSFMRRQQRKKIEGGGFVEVPAVGVALRLANPAIEEAAKKEREATARKNEEERRQREAAEREANEWAFAERLTKEYGGKKLVYVSVFCETITLQFDDGSELVISQEGGDLYDAWINVNEISIRTFEFNRK